MKPPEVFSRLLFVIAITLTACVACNYSTWQAESPKNPEEYFEHGSIGAEQVPLPVFLVLPDLYPNNFQPGGEAAGDWIDQFGFIRRPHPHDSARDYDLPVGLTATDHQPESGKYSPIPFVGLTCAACHEGQIRFPGSDQNILVRGMGNPALDLVAFGDAVKCSLLDPGLTVESINDQYKEKSPHRSLTLLDRYVIRKWLGAVRDLIRHDIAGPPKCGSLLREATAFPSGPGRIMAARDAIKRVAHEMPVPNGGPSKLPVLYHQARREWAQFDGSVRNPLTRNAVAALGVGAKTENLQVPDILGSVLQSFSYVVGLDADPGKVFPQTNENSVKKGREIYMEHCATCHGYPAEQKGEWTSSQRLGKVILAAEIGTDPERVRPKYYDQLPQLFFDEYPQGHPLKPQANDVRATHGYITTPLEGVFSRAPFLHNGSVATLAEPINLKPRRNLFYRGTEFYDVTDVGLLVSDTRDSKRYYRFDTSIPGNSNKGHDFPWPYDSPRRDEAKLKDLLEYLKTL